MTSPGASELKWRSLLTETLPYEVPVIFSNEVLFASLVSDSGSGPVRALVGRMRDKLDRFTIPYSYEISKDESRSTSLAIVHPNHQLRFSEFYEQYAQSMLDYCSRSTMSLRRPMTETPIFSDSDLSTDAPLKLGIPHVAVAEGEIDTSHISSYFTYGKYNLMGKFFDSGEFRRLEKRYKFMRTIDVSKCFFNIYTHSITWAVKGKDFAKAQGDVYSFEGRFDRLMQKANYNETNGIVVGPELSRIFAEIIFQDIDLRVETALLPDRVHERHYALRRYVDDYFVFCNSQQDLDVVHDVLRDQLERYKLFINAHKTVTSTRPFVSQISLARSELGGLIEAIHDCLDDISGNIDPLKLRRKARNLKRNALDIRLICERYEVTFNTLSGWLLSTLRYLLQRSVNAIAASQAEDVQQALTDMSVALLDIIFYICALDLRVRSTYSLCQIVAVTERLDKSSHPDSYDRIMHVLAEELGSLIRTQLYANVTIDRDRVELYNLLIIGAHYLGSQFIKSGAARDALDAISLTSPISYFGFITAKFCFLKDPAEFQAGLAALNASARSRVEARKGELGRDSEAFLLACDYMSSPDVAPSDKRTLWKTLGAGEPSNADADAAGRYLAFADWTGVRIEHVLARKELRPVYVWA